MLQQLPKKNPKKGGARRRGGAATTMFFLKPLGFMAEPQGHSSTGSCFNFVFPKRISEGAASNKGRGKFQIKIELILIAYTQI